MPEKPKKSRAKRSKHKAALSKIRVCVIKNRCKGCGFCVESCPKKILEMSKETNEKGYRYPLVIDQSGCINCKRCEDICPDFAIFISAENKT